VNQGKTAEAIAEWKRDAGRTQAQEMSNELTNFKEREVIVVQERQKEQDQALDNLTMAVILVVITSTIVAILQDGSLLIKFVPENE
jgi:CHASE3 domain sensor protein